MSFPTGMQLMLKSLGLNPEEIMQLAQGVAANVKQLKEDIAQLKNFNVGVTQELASIRRELEWQRKVITSDPNNADDVPKLTAGSSNGNC